jgi:hypothetical protein
MVLCIVGASIIRRSPPEPEKPRGETDTPQLVRDTTNGESTTRMIDGTCTTTPQPLPSHRSARSSPSGRQASAPSSTFHPSSRRQEVVPRRHFHHRRCSNVSDEAQPSETSAEENCASDQGELRAEVVELPDLAPIHSPEGDEDGMSFSRTPHRHWINRRELTSQSELEPRQSLNPRKSTLLLPRSSLVSFRARSSPHRRKSSMVHFGSTQEESSTVLSKLAPGRSPILRRQSQRTSPLGAVLPPHPRLRLNQVQPTRLAETETLRPPQDGCRLHRPRGEACRVR